MYPIKHNCHIFLPSEKKFLIIVNTLVAEKFCCKGCITKVSTNTEYNTKYQDLSYFYDFCNQNKSLASFIIDE